MALIQTKLYDEQVTDLENMADGAKKHQGNSKVKATMKEADFRNRKKEIEDLREKYNLLLADTNKAYDEFAKKFDDNRLYLNTNVRVAKGIFGRSAPELKDFGIKPEKK